MSEHLRGIVTETQKDVFRLAEREHGLNRKVISHRSGIKYDQLCAYARGEHIMPVTEVLKLCDVLPDYLLDRFFDCVGRRLSRCEGQTDPLELIEAGLAGLREMRS
jgi:hypothetical protein